MSHGRCHLCEATCRLCSGPESDDCLSCPESRFFDEGRCVIRCERGRYAMERQCHLCHHTCQDCDDGGPDNCTGCDKDKFGTPRYLYEGECRDACPEGFFHSWRRRCEACPANCSVCSSAQHCQRCSPAHYLKDQSCVPLECGEGEVADPEYEDCLPCEQGCKKCLQKNPRKCIACAEGFYQLGPDCYQNCPDRTYSVDAPMQCVHCENPHCINCDQAQCYWCEEGYYVSDGECVQHCKEGFFVDEESQECEPCHRACRSCGGPAYDDCDACEDGSTLRRGECVDDRLSAPCPDKRFRNGQGDCQQCHASCLSCSGPGEEECNTCDSGDFLSARQSCVSVCPAGWFGDAASGRCADCVPGCVLCQDGRRCLRCGNAHTHLYLQDGLCVAECQGGYPRGGECQPCARGCASCLGNATHCLSCSAQYLLLDHACEDRCPDGHYPQDGLCRRCPPDCARCTAGLCQECEQYYFLHEDECVGDCPRGFFPSPGQMECVRCHGDCAGCDGPDQDDCVACRNPAAVRYNGECLSRCPAHSYHNTHASECRDCDRSCLTCSGPEPSSCLSCGSNMRLDGTGHCVFYSRCSPGSYVGQEGACLPCHADCHRCDGAARDRCVSCDGQLLLLNHTCVDECPVGYYGDRDERVCERCHPSCASCRGRHSGQCLTCSPGLFRLGGSCVESCGDSHFGNATTMACDRCDPSCGQCHGRGRGQCLTCREGYLYHRHPSGRCLQVCPNNFYPDTEDKECRRCHPTCKTCDDDGALACKTCYHGYRHFAGICESDCPVGYYTPWGDSTSEGSGSKGFGVFGSDAACVLCDRSCVDCWGPGQWNCTVCPALQMLSDDRRCLSCCGDAARDGHLQHQCCDCKASYDECVLGVNFVFGSPEDLAEQQGGRPALFILTSIFLILSLGTGVFLLLRTRYCAGRPPAAGFAAYHKLGGKGGGATAADLASSPAVAATGAYGEYSDRIVQEEDEEEEEEQDDDIVYMGQDGTVYRKFRYGLLEEDEELEMEYDDESYSFT